ncbi:hypothetical protein ACP275_12G125500 [Erythranthe tilingii]
MVELNDADLVTDDKSGFSTDIKIEDAAAKLWVAPENLSRNVVKRVEVLREIQSEHDVLEAKFCEERESLEAKYQKLYQPLYTKRYEIVNGVVEGGITESGTTNEEKGVPDFWLIAMKNNEILAEEISERDEGALKFLKDIKWSRIDDPKGFKLEFYFDTNPFFKNSVLTKIYHVFDEDEEEPVLEKAIGTEIDWYPGKCLTKKILKKKPKNGPKNAKPITKTEQCQSFFNFFSPPDVPDDIDDENAADELQELQNLMEQDYDVGATIRDEIIPHAVLWFTGEAAEDEYGDSEDEDDDDEDDDDDDDDEDEDEIKNTKKKGGRASAGEGQQGDKPAECNQQ